MLAWPVAAAAQVAPPTVPASSVPAPSGEAAPTAATIKSINIVGNQRLEAQTILSYLRLRVGQNYDRSVLDQALKDLAATELFKDYQISDDNGALTIQVAENPVINRVILEGNKRLKEDKIRPEIKLAPRQIFTRSKVRADVARIIELYKRQGRFAATVDPKMVQLDQNRVDVVFEINEGPKSKVRQINIIGNEKFSDGDLKDEMATKESGLLTILSSNTSYDPDRLAYDQQKLRLFYLQNGYADFRVISAVAELTSNKQDFIITYVVEEGERYKFGKVDVKSDLRDFKPEMLQKLLPMKTGELSLSAGFSSIESFLLQASIRQRNFRGLGQQLQASVNYSSYSKSIELGFTEPYLFDRNISIGGSVYRRDLNSFNFINNDRETTFEQTTTGFQVNVGVPLTEFMSFFGRYSLNYDDVTLDKNLYYFGGQCDPLVAGRYLCDAIGTRTTSLVGFTLAYDDRDNRLRPTRGQSLSLSQDFAGLGGSVKYVRTRLSGSKHFNLGSRFILNISAEGGYIYPFGNAPSPTSDKVRLTDRFFLGEPQMRGFDIRGIGPRVIRFTDVDLADPANPVLNDDLGNRNNLIDDALGGRAYYQGRIEMDIPLGTGAKELGLRPSVFLDVGSVWSVKRPTLTTLADFKDPSDGLTKWKCRNSTTGQTTFATLTAGSTTPLYSTCDVANGFSPLPPFEERFYGNTWMPRVAIGAGVNWNSPFGPFRIDFAYALRKEEGDDTKRFSFNVGTQF